MANTNTPRTNTQGQMFVPAFGEDTISLNNLSDRTLAKFSLIDCMPTVIKNVGKDPSYSVMPRPPIIFRTNQAVGHTIVAVAKGEDTAPTYVLRSNGEIYESNPSIGVYTLFATLSNTGPYFWTSGLQFVIAGVRYMAFLVAGTNTNLYIYNLSAGGAPTNVDMTAAGIGFLRDLRFLDGYLFAHNGTYVYNSKVGFPGTWAPSVDFIAVS